VTTCIMHGHLQASAEPILKWHEGISGEPWGLGAPRNPLEPPGASGTLGGPLERWSPMEHPGAPWSPLEPRSLGALWSSLEPHGAPGALWSPGKSQKEGQEEQGTSKHLGGTLSSFTSPRLLWVSSWGSLNLPELPKASLKQKLRDLCAQQTRTAQNISRVQGSIMQIVLRVMHEQPVFQHQRQG
jgi:hypothetical protein